jgi:hypothetical protein
MTDGQWLFVLFTLLYLAECLRLVPAGAWLFASAGSRGWLRRAFAPLDFSGRRVLLLPVLPPLSAHTVLMPWRQLPCEAGLEVLNEGGQQEAMIVWADLKPVVVDGALRLDAHHRVRFHHAGLAEKAAVMLRKWSGMKLEARERDFEKMARASLDEKVLMSHLAESAQLTRRLRGLAAVIFVLCFGIIPVIYRWFGDGVEVMWAAGLMLVMMWTQAVMFWRVAGRLKEGKVPYRFWKTLAMLFLPQFGLRASDHIIQARPLEMHPLAACASLPEPERLKLARQWWKSVCYSSAASSALQQRVFSAFWKQQHLDESLLEQIPERQPGSTAYCPRCQSQFREADMLCQDCGGLPLKPF